MKLRSGGSYQASASFVDGSRETWNIDMCHGPNYMNVRAYAAKGSGCFVLLDVSKLYGEGKQPIKVLEAFRHTHVLEKKVDNATVLEHGKLPREAAFNRRFDTLVWTRPVACQALGGDGAIAKLEAEFNRSMHE